MTNHQNGPPGLEVGPRPGHHSQTEDTDTDDTSRLDSADRDIVSQHLRRRAASWRLPMLESSRSDPWWREPPAAGYDAAAVHLLGHGLTPAPDRDGLRRMWMKGGYHRRAAGRIAAAWEMAA